MNLLDNLWQFLLFVVSLLSPFEAKRPAIRVSPGLRLFLHVLIIALIVAAMWWLNDAFKIYEKIPDPAWARHWWLPILFLLFYALAVTAFWIYQLLMAEPDAAEFPDIDEAWEAVLDALDRSGIALTEAPLFLVLGRPEAPEEHLFQAAQLNLVVKGEPIGVRHPIHVYANRDGIFLTCSGCSTLAKQAGLLALEGIAEDAVATNDAPIMGLTNELDATLKPGQAEQKIIRQIARIHGTQINGYHKRALRRDSKLPMPNLLANPQEVETQTLRLAHLCRLVVRDRQPYCPINGVLVLVPLGATDTDKDAQATADLCRNDLNVVRRIMKVQCPIFAMVVDMEQLPGFREFIHRRTADERKRRIGQRFPLNPPDLRGDDLEDKLGESILWLGHHGVRDLVYKIFKADAAKLDANHELFLLLDEMRIRKDHLAQFLVQAIARDADAPLLFGGCYLAATGAEKDRDQAFIRGVLARLFDQQHCVAWTDQARIEDARYHSMTFFGYVALAVLVVLLGGAFAYQFGFLKRD